MNNKQKVPEDIILERYAFLLLADKDMIKAESALKLSKKYKRQDTIYYLVRDSIVSYSRPFMNNYGQVVKIHKLKGKYVQKNILIYIKR